MTKYIKKYWWFIIIVLFIPKTIDVLYNQYLCDFMVMKYIEALDLLGYISTIIGAGFSVIAILVAIRQFEKADFEINLNFIMHEDNFR